MLSIESFTLAALLLEKRKAVHEKTRFYRTSGMELLSLLIGFLAVTLLVTALEFSTGEDQNRVATRPTTSDRSPQSHEGKLK